MQSVASHLELDEVVSPELALVDPGLAEIARGHLRLAPEWRPHRHRGAPGPLLSPARPPMAVATPPPGMPSFRSRPHRRPASSVVATAIPLLLLGAVVFAMVASEVRAQSQDPVALLQPALASDPKLGGLDPVTLLPTTSEVEVRTLALLTNASTAAPAALLDDRRGVLANDVWIECLQVYRSPQFTCRLGVGRSSSRQWALTVAITSAGKEVFSWGGRVRRADRGAIGSAL
jgi:hypothetical protein